MFVGAILVLLDQTIKKEERTFASTKPVAFAAGKNYLDGGGGNMLDLGSLRHKGTSWAAPPSVDPTHTGKNLLATLANLHCSTLGYVQDVCADMIMTTALYSYRLRKMPRQHENPASTCDGAGTTAIYTSNHTDIVLFGCWPTGSTSHSSICTTTGRCQCRARGPSRHRRQGPKIQCRIPSSNLQNASPGILSQIGQADCRAIGICPVSISKPTCAASYSCNNLEFNYLYLFEKLPVCSRR